MLTLTYVFFFVCGVVISYSITWSQIASMREKISVSDKARFLLGDMVADKNAELEGAKKLEAASAAVIVVQDKVIAQGEAYMGTLQKQVVFYKNHADKLCSALESQLASTKSSAKLH